MPNDAYEWIRVGSGKLGHAILTSNRTHCGIVYSNLHFRREYINRCQRCELLIRMKDAKETTNA